VQTISIGKPFEAALLDARLKALERIQRLPAAALGQRVELRVSRAKTLHEQAVAAAVMDRYVRWDPTSAPNVRTSLKHAELFNGDIFMVARTPSGTQRFLLGDVTGHGLPAAVCAIPASELFQTLTARGAGLGETSRALNRRLNSVISDGLFMAAVLVELDFRQGMPSIWNGGLPTVHQCRPRGGVAHSFLSRHVPLAIRDEESFDARFESVSFEPGDRLYLRTDGLVELPDLERDGEQLLLDTLNFQSDLETTFDDVIDRMSEARGRIESHDDATLIEIACTFPELVENAPELADENGGWDYTVRFDSAALKRADLILMVTPVMESMVPKQELREVALTVLGGLFTNALDHGVLGLSSTLKHGEGGFERYLCARMDSLSSLTEGSVAVTLESE